MTFLLPLIGLVAGILAGSFLEGPLWGALPILAGLSTYFIILRKSTTPFKAAALNSRHAIWVLLLFSGIGIMAEWFHRPQGLEEKEITGYVAGVGEVTDVTYGTSGDAFIIDVDRLFDGNGQSREFRNMKIRLLTDGFSAEKGDILFFPCSLDSIKDPENYRSSGYADMMRKKGIIYSTRASCNDIKTKGHSSSLSAKASAWRDRIEIALEKSQLDRETCEFIISILLGDRIFLSPDVRESFSNAGVAHVLALSGMHVAIIIGIILFLLFPLKTAGLHNTRRWIAVALIWAYAFFTGLAPSTVRACIMTTFLVLAISMQRKNASQNALLASAFVILLLEPSAISDIGMQLSFLCVAGIITFAEPLNTVSRHTHPKLHAINGSILVSLVATMSTWVVVSYYFKRIPLLFLPVNLLLLPLLPFHLTLALAYTGLCLFGIDISFLAKTLDFFYSAFIRIVEYFSAFGSATIEYQATLPVVVLWLLGVLVIGYAMKRSRKAVAFITAGALFAGSIVLIPVMSSSQPDSMIFQKKYSEISMALYDSDKENVLTFPRYALSKIDFKGSEIFSIDCMNNLDSLATMLMKQRTGNKKRYLIIGSGFRKSLREIPGLERFDKIILHPSVRRKEEKKLMQEAMDYGLKHIHSLRNDGPLEVVLPKD